MCKKIAYQSRRDAGLAPGRYGKPYRCPRCGMWHVGHKLRRKQRATLQAERRRECYQPMIELVEVMCGVNLHGSSKATRSDRVSG